MFPVSELLDGRSTASWWLIIVCPRRTPRSHRGHQTNGGVISLIWQPGHLIKYFLGSDYRSHPPLRGRLVVWLYTERSVWWSDFTYGGQDGGLAREVRMEVWLERSWWRSDFTYRGQDGGLTLHREVRMEVRVKISDLTSNREVSSQLWPSTWRNVCYGEFSHKKKILEVLLVSLCWCPEWIIDGPVLIETR